MQHLPDARASLKHVLDVGSERLTRDYVIGESARRPFEGVDRKKNVVAVWTVVITDERKGLLPHSIERPNCFCQINLLN